MLTKRMIACLDVNAGRVVKGVQFVDLVDAGDPAEVAARHAAAGADEIVFLDITATHEARGTLIETVKRTAQRLFVPFTVGGGIRTLDDAAAVFDAGADKISINSAALARPELIGEIGAKFGAQAVIVAIDARRTGREPEKAEVFVAGGRTATGRRAVDELLVFLALGAAVWFAIRGTLPMWPIGRPDFFSTWVSNRSRATTSEADCTFGNMISSSLSPAFPTTSITSP